MARVVFMGTPQFAVPTLQRLIRDGHELIVVTQPDRPAGRGKKIEMPPVKQAALPYHLPVWQPESVNTVTFLAQLREWKPEVGVVVAFGQILGPELLRIPAHGYLNVHASLLPRYRGASPVAAAILAGDAVTGTTIMLIDEGLDTGPILTQEHISIGRDDTTATLESKLALVGAELLARTLPPWLKGQITPRSQDESQATFAGHIEKDDGRVNWSFPAETLWRMARAYDPWPGLFTFLDNKQVKLWRVRPLPDWQGDEFPGEVILNTEDLVVATGEGALILEEVQLAGKKRLSGREFRRGQHGLRKFE